ncbi:MAG: hypothetical protein RL219_631 [Actinomycetota bacterium]
MRRITLPLAATIVLALAACSSDGRSLAPPNNNNESIIKATEVTDPDEGFDDGVEFDDTLPSEDAIEGEGGMTMTVPFTSDGPIPAKFTCAADNVSPAITWDNLPEGTVEVAVQVIDLESENFTHWVIAGLRPEAGGIGEGEVPEGAIQAKNSKGTIGYFGPCPPVGSTHTYLFEVDALDRAIELTNGVDADTLLEAIGEATVQSASDSGKVAG